MNAKLPMSCVPGVFFEHATCNSGHWQISGCVILNAANSTNTNRHNFVNIIVGQRTIMLLQTYFAAKFCFPNYIDVIIFQRTENRLYMYYKCSVKLISYQRVKHSMSRKLFTLMSGFVLENGMMFRKSTSGDVHKQLAMTANCNSNRMRNSASSWTSAHFASSATYSWAWTASPCRRSSQPCAFCPSSKPIHLEDSIK